MSQDPITLQQIETDAQLQKLVLERWEEYIRRGLIVVALVLFGCTFWWGRLFFACEIDTQEVWMIVFRLGAILTGFVGPGLLMRYIYQYYFTKP